MKSILLSFFFSLICIYSSAQNPQWKIFDKSNSKLPENKLKSLILYKNSSLWMGTAGEGVVKFDRKENWNIFNESNSGLPNNHVDSVAIDRNGCVWIGTGHGVAKYDPEVEGNEAWKVFNTSNSKIPNDDIYPVAIDRSRDISARIDDPVSVWIGTFGGGIAKFSGNQWAVYNSSNSPLPDNNIRSLTVDKDGNKWIGTLYGGLAKFNGDATWVIYNASNSGLPNNAVYPVKFDKYDNLWIGTENGGLAKFDGDKSWTVYNTSNSGLPHNFIYTLAFDSAGNIWIGTAGGGIAKFDTTDTWTVYNTFNSALPCNEVRGIAVDGEGSIWISTYGGGLARFNENGEGWEGTQWNDLEGFDPAFDGIWPLVVLEGMVKKYDILTKKNKDRAINKLAEYLIEYPDDSKALILYIQIGFMHKEYKEEMMKSLEKVVEKNPKNAEAWYWIGKCYGPQEKESYKGDVNYSFVDYDKAVASMKKAISIDTQNEKYREHLALYLTTKRNFEEARVFIRQVKAEKHPVYMLLKDLQKIPIHESTIFLPDETKILISKMRETGTVDNYYELRVHVFALPLSMNELEKFYEKHLPEFRTFPTAKDKIARVYSYRQYLRFIDGEMYTSNGLEEIPEKPKEGIMLDITHYNPKILELSSAPSFVKEMLQLHPELKDKNSFCKIVYVSYR